MAHLTESEIESVATPDALSQKLIPGQIRVKDEERFFQGTAIVNNKRDKQHETIADPVQTTRVGGTDWSLLPHDPQGRRRRSIRLQGYDYAQVGAYFVTVCAHNRGCAFGEIVNNASRMVHAAWEDLPRDYAGIELDVFVVMPDHVHVIMVIVGAGLKPAPTVAIPSNQVTFSDLEGVHKIREVFVGKSKEQQIKRKLGAFLEKGLFAGRRFEYKRMRGRHSVWGRAGRERLENSAIHAGLP